MRPSERLGWTADVVAPSPDRVLEVGCGHGVLVSLFAARLTTGLVVGIDRVLAAGLHRGRTAPTESVALELPRGI